MSDADRQYSRRFKGICDSEIELVISVPSWLDGSYLNHMIDHIGDEMKRHIATEHPGSRSD